MVDWLTVTSIGFGLLGMLFTLAALASARRGRFARLSLHTAMALEHF